MSRPPPPPSSHQHSRASPTMADTQAAPNFPPGAYLDYSNRRLPQPIQLPPLAIPQGSPGAEYHQSPTQSLPSIHSGATAHPPPLPAPRSQPRSYSSQAAPLEKLLSPHPYTPPRSDSAYSPQLSPPRSHLDSRPPPPPPPPPPAQHTQHAQPTQHSQHSPHLQHTHHPQHPQHRRYASDDHRISHPEPAYISPIEPPRSVYQSLPSPASSYPPSYPQHSHYRQPVPPSTVSAPPPPPPPPQYASPVYSEPAAGPPPPRIVPAALSAPISAPDPERSRLRYELKVRQQPIAARACGFGERDRRVIDPPPIIQLTVTDPDTGVVDLDELRYSLNVVHCTLWNADGTGEETALIQPDRRTTRRLMGQLVASPSVAKDEHDVEGCFFCFPDLSCRTHGRYRLRFVLMRIDPKNLHVGGSSPILTEVLSDVFQVYTAKDFPGMRPSSALTRALKLQGCNIQVKKGNEKALARKRISPSSEDDREEKGAKKRRSE